MNGGSNTGEVPPGIPYSKEKLHARMEAFDQLPAVLRQLLNDAPLPLCPVLLRKLIDQYGPGFTTAVVKNTVQEHAKLLRQQAEAACRL